MSFDTNEAPGVQVELYSSNFGFSNPEQNGQLNGARSRARKEGNFRGVGELEAFGH